MAGYSKLMANTLRLISLVSTGRIWLYTEKLPTLSNNYANLLQAPKKLFLKTFIPLALVLKAFRKLKTRGTFRIICMTKALKSIKKGTQFIPKTHKIL